MRVLLDESVEFRLLAYLKAQGHDVTANAHDYPHALPDADVLAIAAREGRILLTNDRDFGDLIVRDHLPHAGVIYFRLPAATVRLKIDRLAAVLSSHRDQPQHLLVVTERDVRVRRTEPSA